MCGPGDKLDVDLLSNGRMQVRSRRGGTSVAAIFGMLGKPGPPPLSVEELNEVAASGWVGERC